jgi:hypothetical protein
MNSRVKVDPYNASRLLSKALQPGLNTANDTEYRELIALYRADAEFRTFFADIARGLELEVLDWSEQGIVVVPDGHKSLFACRLGDIRSGLNESEKASLVLIFVAIATVFFPTSESLDNDEFHPPPTKVADFRDAVHLLANRMRDEDKHDNTSEALRPGWEYLASLPLVSPKSENQRAGLNSVVGLIKLALNNLRDAGLVRLDQSMGEDLQHTYTPTFRFRVQLR